MPEGCWLSVNKGCRSSSIHVTLETRGEFNFHGALNDVSPFAAHPKFDPATGEMFNFGIAFGANEPYLNFYRFDAGANLVFRKRLPLEYPCSIHDFGLSQNYAVFYFSPYILDMQAFVRERRSLMDSLSWEPERGSRLVVVSRETGEKVTTTQYRIVSCLHFINCFEEDGRLNVDVLELERPIYDQYARVPTLFTEICEGWPVRFVVDLKSNELIETSEVHYRLAPDFPAIDPALTTRTYDDFWMLGISATGKHGRKFFDQLVHVKWPGKCACDVYQVPARHYLGSEPIFISNPAGSGAVICHIFDAENSSSAFALFDATQIARGPIAVLRLKERVHLGFHASFAAQSHSCFAPEEQHVYSLET